MKHRNGVFLLFVIFFFACLGFVNINSSSAQPGDDRFEQNDSFNFASTVAAGVYSGLIQSDADYFKVLSPVGIVWVNVEAEDPGRVMNLQLYDANRSPISVSYNTWNVSAEMVLSTSVYIYIQIS